MTLIRIGLLYPSIHNSLIANTRIEVKLAKHVSRVAFGNDARKAKCEAISKSKLILSG